MWGFWQIVTFLGGFAFPPLWLLFAWLQWREGSEEYNLTRPLKAGEKRVFYQRFPCPRCANDQVQVYSGNYFACRDCGARGRYPFLDFADRRRRMNGKDPFFYKVEKVT